MRYSAFLLTYINHICIRILLKAYCLQRERVLFMCLAGAECVTGATGAGPLSWGFPLVPVCNFPQSEAHAAPARRGMGRYDSGNMTFIKPCQLWMHLALRRRREARGTRGAQEQRLSFRRGLCVKVARALPPPGLTCALSQWKLLAPE